MKTNASPSIGSPRFNIECDAGDQEPSNLLKAEMQKLAPQIHFISERLRLLSPTGVMISKRKIVVRGSSIVPGVFVVLALAASFCTKANAKDQPNVLIVMADDCTHNDLPIYGGKNARTPNIDQLASEGLIFRNAFLTSAMCQPCRAELYSGMFPMGNGCAWNHSASFDETRSLPHYLSGYGYRVGIAGKVHVQPKKAYPFETVDGFDASCVRDPTREHHLRGVNEFITRNGTQPFCLVVALVEPHVPWVMGDASVYPPEKLELPSNLADTELTREAYSRYLAEITYMDSQVGELISLLDQSGKASETLVIFTSEQGSQFPGNKWTNWDTGLHTGLVLRWPNVIESGRSTEAIVHYADVVPTLIEAAGGDLSKLSVDGRSFLSVILDEQSRHRRYAYGAHNNVPEGPPYPIRTISNGEFRYVRNLQPHRLYIEKHLMGLRGSGALNNPYWQTWIWDSWNTPQTYDLVQRYMQRPPEALYHTKKDPYELENLIAEPQYEMILNELRQELDHWLKTQGDPGVEMDSHATHQAAKRGDHLFRPPTRRSSE